MGWVDGDELYLDPDASYRVVQQMAGGSEGIAISAQALRKRLDERGLLIREAARESLTVRRTLEGTMRNVLHLRHGTIHPAESETLDSQLPAPAA